MNINIKTERLFIRRFVLSDSKDYYEIFGNPAIAKYDDFSPITENEAEHDIEKIINAYRDETSEELEFAVEYTAEKKVTGVIHLEKKESFFIGYHFNEKYHGRGMAFESVSAFIDYLEANYGRKIKAIVDPANTPSIKLLGKLSFVFLDETTKADGSGKNIVEHIYERKKSAKEG